MEKLIEIKYSSRGAALAAAGYLNSFGLDAEPKLLKNAWRVVVHRPGHAGAVSPELESRAGTGVSKWL